MSLEAKDLTGEEKEAYREAVRAVVNLVNVSTTQLRADLKAAQERIKELETDNQVLQMQVAKASGYIADVIAERDSARDALRPFADLYSQLSHFSGPDLGTAVFVRKGDVDCAVALLKGKEGNDEKVE